MSVFSVLVKSTEKTGIEAAAAAGGKENIGDVPLMGLVCRPIFIATALGAVGGGLFPNSTPASKLPVTCVRSIPLCPVRLF